MARIIIAEDNKIFMVVYKRIIELLGHECAGFTDGAQAVAAFKQEPADMVILDYEMPEMNGLETTREIRRLPEGVSVPIFIVSSHGEEEIIAECLNAGASDYMVKPVRETQLLAKIKVGLRSSSLNKKDFDLAKNGAEIAGRFKIERLLGYGAHSLVFLATDMTNAGAKVAVKLLNENVDDKDFLAAVISTATSLENLDSPNILRVLGHGSFSGRVYIAMDYADGGDLAGVLRHGNLNQVETARLAVNILSGLADLSRDNLCHFDLKPENILIKEGRYVLADFGVIVARETVTINLSQELWSTAAYMAPEYYRGDAVDIRSDLYALGVTLYKAITGINPFEAPKPAITMYRQVNFTPPLVLEYEKGLDPELADLIASMLAKEPERRPDLAALLPTFMELSDRLEGLARKVVPATHQPGHVPEAAPEQPTPNAAPPQPAVGAAPNDKAGAEWERQSLRPEQRSPQEVVHAAARPRHVDKRHWLAWGVAAVVVALSTLLSYALHGVLVGDKKVPSGAVVCLRCQNCGAEQQRRIVDIANEHCVQCSAPLGYATKCLACGNQFGVKPTEFPANADKAALLAADIKAKSCPKCHSPKTVPVQP